MCTGNPHFTSRFSFLSERLGEYTLSLFHQSYPIHCLQKFTDREDLYLHHRNIYDRIMRKRIAYLPPDFESIVGLVLVGLKPYIGWLSNFIQYFTDYFPAVVGGLPRIS